jgi:predicted protein tyrosine phosphatase
MKTILFLCSRNRLRSPTAEAVFANREDLEVASAGLNQDSDEPVSRELVRWGDVIFVMEKAHLTRLWRRFRRDLRGQRVICLDIADRYEFMEPALVELLEARVGGYLGRGTKRRVDV